MKQIKYDGHELALLFPRMTAPELEQLGDNIKESGLQEEIVLHEGKILDGLNRYTACLDTGTKPRFRNFGSRESDGKSPTAFVNAHNLQRRHLKSASQKAALAANLLPYYQAEAAIAGGGDTLGMAAAAAGSNRTYTAEAAQLKKDDPEAFDQVQQGTVSLPDAVKAAADKKAADKAQKQADNRAIRELKRENAEAIKATHSAEFAEAFDKGVILKKLDELKAFLKLDPATQLSIAPLLPRQFSVKAAVKMMTGELSGEDSIATLICRAISHDSQKGSKQYKVVIDGHVIQVRKSIENAD